VILVLRDANFDVGKSVLRPAARVTLDSLAHSKGKADPIAPNSTAEGRQQNRRVVIDKQQQ
jgi:outer membrane protein OmpA-like peptidoglycan-associated protein